MVINITVYSSLAKHYPGLVDKTLSYCGEPTVKGLIADIGLSAGKIGLIFINKKRADRNSAINDGDTVQFYPFLGGG